MTDIAKCFSIVFSNNESIDLKADTVLDAAHWISGLRSLTTNFF